MPVSLDISKYAVIYPRQSSKEQVENNVYSLERQLQLRELAVEAGFPEEQILVVDDDLGISGRSIEKRPGFSRALKLINQGLVAAIYVEDLTRLSRDDRTIDQMVIADACERSGTLIYMGRSWYDMRDSGQRQSYKYQAVGASESWKAHLEKLHAAQRRKATQGRAAGQVPRGYRPKKDVSKRDPQRDILVVHQEEAAIIRAIAQDFSRAGSLFKLYERHRPIYWPDGTECSFTAMCKFLKSPIHRGIFVWGDVRLEGTHEAIIPPELATEIDHLLALNRQTSRKPGEGGFGELAGLIWCGECGRKMKAYGGQKDPAYRCSERTKEARHINYHRSTSVTFIDPIVLEQFWPALLDGDLVAGVIEKLRQRREEYSSVHDRSETHRRILQRRVDGWMVSLGDPGLPEVARKMIQQQLGDALRELESIKTIAGPSEQPLDDSFYLELRGNPEMLEALPVTWETQPLKWRRSFLRRFIEAVEIREQAHSYVVTVRWLDGQETRRAVPFWRPGWGQEELGLLRSLMDSASCPTTTARARNTWLMKQLRKAGFTRTREAIQKKVRELQRS